jgi:hypothetical protein
VLKPKQIKQKYKIKGTWKFNKVQKSVRILQNSNINH